ncbi:MAG: SCO family protein [Xanthomonadales bacterium]|nr:SCO family protein [Xanthomonadales bacterium]
MRALKFGFTLLLVILLQSCKQPLHWNATDISNVMPNLEFTLLGPDGESVESDSLRGKPLILFFGFTNCPNICPTTLTRLSVLMKELGPKANDIQMVLVSVDPGRDTPEVMKRYTASFGPWLLGLTGPEEDLARLREAYGVYASMESSDSKGTYNVMHATVVLAFDANGQARLLISDLDDSDAVLSDLKQLIDL